MARHMDWEKANRRQVASIKARQESVTSFKARYAGTCKRCGKRYPVGRKIHWVMGGYMHASCPE